MTFSTSLAPIKLFLVDVDGVMTDGRVWIDATGEWRRQFNVLDGVGLKRLMSAGYLTGVITGANSQDVRARIGFLGIPHFHQNIGDKVPVYEDILAETGLSDREVAYIGDDVFDAPLIERSGFGATVPGAVDEALECADYVTRRSGGLGAVREICDLILKYGALSHDH